MFKIFTRKRKPGIVYWVNLADIKIQPEFRSSDISPEKYENKKNYYLNTGEFESAIYLRKDNTLVDDYSTYLIAKEFDLGKIPVVYGEY